MYENARTATLQLEERPSARETATPLSHGRNPINASNVVEGDAFPTRPSSHLLRSHGRAVESAVLAARRRTGQAHATAVHARVPRPAGAFVIEDRDDLALDAHLARALGRVVVELGKAWRGRRKQRTRWRIRAWRKGQIHRVSLGDERRSLRHRNSNGDGPVVGAPPWGSGRCWSRRRHESRRAHVVGVWLVDEAVGAVRRVSDGEDGSAELWGRKRRRRRQSGDELPRQGACATPPIRIDLELCLGRRKLSLGIARGRGIHGRSGRARGRDLPRLFIHGPARGGSLCLRADGGRSSMTGQGTWATPP